MALRLVRTGDQVLDRNFDELHRHLRDSTLSGTVGDPVTLVSGTNRLKPSAANPKGRSTVFTSDGTVTISDVGLDAEGFWVVTASGPCTARFAWHH